MGLGVKAKYRRGPTVQIDYLIHIHEIKPWPPSQSLRSLRSVLIQWENGDRNSGSTNPVVPSLGSVVGEGKIEFNHSFRLPVTLLRDMSVKGGGDGDAFQKNCLEFHLYEPRRDKTKPFVKGRTSSSSGDSLSRGASLDKAGGESVSGLMNEDYAEEAEVASFTDDDVSSHSSQTISSALDTNRTLSPKKQETGEETRPHSTEGKNEKHALASKLGLERPNLIHEFMKGGSSCSSSVDLSSDPGSPVNGNASVANSPSSSSTILKAVGSETAPSPSASALNEKAEESHTSMRSNGHERLSHELMTRFLMAEQAQREGESFIAHDANGKQDPLGTKENIKHVKSVRSAIDSAKNGLPRNDQNAEVKETGIQGDAQNSAGVAVSLRGKERKDAKVYPRDTRSVILESKIHQLEHRIKLLEGELREAAAVEAALYSVVAEHGSSMSKVHAPARRLSRLYLHACKESSRSRRASAARSIVSGLVLVAKACGNDVPRLTYWLSNSVVLRTIISQVTGEPELLLSPGSSIDRNGAGKVKNNVSSPIKWKAPSSGKKEGMKLLNGSFDCDNPHTFMSTLEKIESWIFSRIVESIWWQTLTPHMQSVAAKELNEGVDSGSRKNYRRTSSSIDQEQSNFSLDLWKKAFRDACERLCPVRAGGHECGCLPCWVMEQSVARLDVAMFNAILRESSDEIPTDPVSDPISDLKVLPIPAGKSSFGAGAQLKSAIGNWSRWLTDLFGMDDDDDSLEDVNDDDDNDERQDKSFKSFHLLNALSDLMMLPKDLLLSKSIRKEVCPAFAAPLIKRILDTFVPDEFCTDPIPAVVLEALESEDTLEVGEEAVTNVPCTGAGTVYLPPQRHPLRVLWERLEANHS
ncbi:uncharacterized protein Pyn_24164 [Prunus yedoensis var. nudiflora]|uniref:C2 NT-type domain-containing protein n=1 Tax=Prunus yedoensis var. nudiflora TaxID=2094558 RepID=A0A314UTM7_PRUYE|nr:uncharacterized protein Pyn_24164 [Prunus yedoensis var. nudiflora]